MKSSFRVPPKTSGFRPLSERDKCEILGLEKNENYA